MITDLPIDDNENVLLGTTLRRRVNIAGFEEYSKITTTGSYLGSYGGFSIYNTHGNCGFDIERLNPEIHKENIYDPELIPTLNLIIVMIILILMVMLILMIIIMILMDGGVIKNH